MPEVKQIKIVLSDCTNKTAFPPYGFYHIKEMYDDFDGTTVAHIGTEIKEEIVMMFAQLLSTIEGDCPVKRDDEYWKRLKEGN